MCTPGLERPGKHNHYFQLLYTLLNNAQCLNPLSAAVAETEDLRNQGKHPVISIF